MNSPTATPFLRIALTILLLTVTGGVFNTFIPRALFVTSLLVMVLLLVGIPLFGLRTRDPSDSSVLDSVADLVPSGALAFVGNAIFVLAIVQREVEPRFTLLEQAFSLETISGLYALLIPTLVGFFVTKRTAKARQWRVFSLVAVLVLLAGIAVLFIWGGGSIVRILSGLKRVSVPDLLHFAVLVISAISAFLAFSASITMDREKVERLNDQPLFMLGFPAGVSAADLATMAMGFRGLAEHYKYFERLALGGAAAAVLSILLVISFWALTMRRPLTKGGPAHYIASLGFSLSAGCTVMYGLAEMAGLFYEAVK